MPRPSRPWFRFYVEAVSDRKMRRLTPAQRWLWVSVLAAARQSCIPGFLMVSEKVAYSWHDLADFAGMRLRDVERGTALFSEMGMIEFDRDLGAWRVPKWNDRQFESDLVTERTRKHRSNEHGRNVPTLPVGTPPETEAETDRELGTASGAPKSRGTRIPDEFTVTDDMAAWADRECPAIDWRAHTKVFVSYWKGEGRANAVKRDWTQAWRTWMLKEQTKAPPWVKRQAEVRR